MTTIVRQSDLAQAFEEVKDEYVKKELKTKEEIEKALKKYPGPKKLALPKGSDVDTVDKLCKNRKWWQCCCISVLSAPVPKDLNFIKTFELHYKEVSEAKKEMEYFINDKTISNVQIGIMKAGYS